MIRISFYLGVSSKALQSLLRTEPHLLRWQDALLTLHGCHASVRCPTEQTEAKLEELISIETIVARSRSEKNPVYQLPIKSEVVYTGANST